MSQQSKDNTCPYWGLKSLCPACSSGSGQQEDSTGHPTAETPDAQPLGNVSGKLDDILSELPRQIQDDLHIYHLSVERDRHGEWSAAYECDTNYDGREYMPIKGQDNAIEIGETIEEACSKLIPRVRTKLQQLGQLPEALPSRETSESDQSPSPSEQEDKPTKPEQCSLTDHRPLWGGDGYYCVECQSRFIIDEPATTAADSKPEKPIVHDQPNVHKNTPEIVHEPSKPDQLRDTLKALCFVFNTPMGDQEAVVDQLQALISQRVLEELIKARDSIWTGDGTTKYMSDRIDELKGQTNG